MPTMIAIIGAGISGISVAKACQDRAIDYVVLEKAHEVGGVWRDNVYPGLGIDSPGATYQFPFAPKYDWSRAFARGTEIQDYLVDVAHRIGIRDRIRFGVEVTECRWEDGAWSLDLDSGETLRAEYLVAGTGFLRVPTVPTVRGQESFEGPSFHSSEWDTTLDVTGKRVGVVGMGSSGIQITTALGKAGVDVVQFIRHPQWVHSLPNPDISKLRRELYRRFPRYGRKKVLSEFDKLRNSDPRMTKNGDWRRFRGPGRDIAVQAFHDDLATVTDPVLRAKLTPEDLPGCKRTPLAPGYYETVQRPNVTIVRGGLHEIRANGVVSDDGDLHEVDVLVYATGFDTDAYHRPMSIRGGDGSRLEDVWKSGPFSYRGIMVPGFPNLFMMHGPYTPVNNIAVPLSTDDMVQFIFRVVAYGDEHLVAISPTDAATQRFLTWVRSALTTTTWADGCDNWYTAADGNTLLWPFAREEHQSMYARFDPDDCHLVSRGSEQALV